MIRLLALLSLLVLSSCYSFKGINIPIGINTFTVVDFENNATNAVPTHAQVFTEDLKQKILSDAPLSYSQADGDVVFEGAITRYEITPINPKPGETNALNRLDISVRVDYTSAVDEKLNWTATFSKNTEYDSSLDLTSIQDGLIEEVNALLVEDIFNRAFAQW